LVATSETLLDIQKVGYIAQSNVSRNVAGLADGSITPEEFEQATAPETIQQSIAAAELPDGAIMDPQDPVQPPPPPPEINAPTSPADNSKDVCSKLHATST